MAEYQSSTEVIDTLIKLGKDPSVVYAYAFGMAWVYLGEKGREKMLQDVRDEINEMENN